MKMRSLSRALPSGLAALFAMMVAASVARATDDEFAGLMPGVELSDQELGSYFGGAILSFTVANGGMANNTGSIDTSQLNTIGAGAFGNASGILTVNQFQGDYNNVSVSINLSVNINTVTISGATTAPVTVTNSLDFGGGVVGAFVH